MIFSHAGFTKFIAIRGVFRGVEPVHSPYKLNKHRPTHTARNWLAKSTLCMQQGTVYNVAPIIRLVKAVISTHWIRQVHIAASCQQYPSTTLSTIAYRYHQRALIALPTNITHHKFTPIHAKQTKRNAKIVLFDIECDLQTFW